MLVKGEEQEEEEEEQQEEEEARFPLAAPRALRQWQQERRVPVAQHFISLPCSLFPLQGISILRVQLHSREVRWAGPWRVQGGKSRGGGCRPGWE